ncbi:Hsp20/alpha crystallin family protein [Singulisphaera acidiphila]|uniref:Molecular chaperone (Small heat shock protein) n=1 Tax=Singulisphaera acidiphila (strain ATCC BAA-1392 / DSM 18658 / VKM B-2454 / MOB10) TaxID=886293 RepID=L0DMW4_SINAD|nr:Hsp20/alpha crystallin family protein [Singulisphaera acidiphila]AGA30170.1 molecular chaperone (small heat shock protein) [Singulisphaera acidiphila DSM 18658]
MSVSNHSIPVAVDRPVSRDSGNRQASTSESLKPPAAYFTPPIDIHESPDGLILEADLPGATENQVSIQLEDNVLSLSAQVNTSTPEGSRILHQEYQVGDFYRSFILSDEVDRSRITAELRNGVLRLILPKAERVKTHRIEIKS